jgi:CheY-like chemotaxis protein
VAGFILVIDDDPSLRDVLQSVLESVGYRVRAEAAPVALAMTGLHRPDLVLLDLEMPLIDGTEVHSCLQADKDTAAIPVVAMGNHTELARHAALPVQGRVVKPFQYKALLSEVARCLPLA